jgi:hypothetical protein
MKKTNPPSPQPAIEPKTKTQDKPNQTTTTPTK